MSINVLTMVGRIANEPELRYTNDGKPVTKFAVCVTDGWGDNSKSYFFDCVCFSHTAEYLGQYAKKGQMVTIQGKLTQNKWEDDKGKHSRVVIVVNECVLPPKGTNSSKGDVSPATGQNTNSQTHIDDNLYGEEVVFDDKDLPF